MKKITFIVACLIASTGFMEAQNVRALSELPNDYDAQQRYVQLPAAYFNSTIAPVVEKVDGIGGTTNFDPHGIRVPFTGTYGNPGTNATNALVYDNGSSINQPGSPDLSILEDITLGMGTYGAGAQFGSGNSVADDVTLTEEYDIDSIDVYSYQTGSTPPSITGIYLQVWDGDPSGGAASVIWGDLTTNIIDDNESINGFRVLESDQGGRTREIQRVTANTSGLTLGAGTYWIQYSLEGSGSSGPWMPPVAILGQSTTGNSIQLTSTGWQPLVDSGTSTPQGLPFQMYGTATGGGTGVDCEEENLNGGTVENGFNCSSASAFDTANDLTVPVGETFTLTNIKASILANDGITNVDVSYYDDESGLPGSMIGSQSSVTIDNQTVVGNAFGYDVNEIELSVNPFDFEGQAGSETTYWIVLSVTDGTSSGNVFWEVTSANMIGNPTAQLDGGWGIPDPLMDGVYKWEGECNVLSVGDNALAGFSYYPNPTSDVLNVSAGRNIDSVALFNLLGQKVMTSTVGANTSQIDLSSLAAGTYVMKVTVDGETGVYKIIKQ